MFCVLVVSVGDNFYVSQRLKL